MRESFIFYKSFYDAIDTLGEKAQLKLYKSIMKLNFNCCENMTELEQLCDEIETSLKQNRNVFAQFLLIKPQILANFSRFLNGSKGKGGGSLGGAPKGNQNAAKNNPKTTPNVFNENVFNVFNENVLNGNGVGVVSAEVQEEKKSHNFYGEYKNVGLTNEQYQKLIALTLSDKAVDVLIEDFGRAIEKGKEQAFSYDLPNAHFERLKDYWEWRRKNPALQKSIVGERPAITLAYINNVMDESEDNSDTG